MPELPEVETTRRGIAPHVQGHTIRQIIVRDRRLRWPVPANLNAKLQGQTIREVSRRGKYLLLRTDVGTLILHLGMSGSLRVLACDTPAEKHDHVDIVLDNGHCVRLRDPRRFGAVLFSDSDPLQHELLRDLGPEPLSDQFNLEYLFSKSRKRSACIKAFIMDSHIVVGVGNIYANEALFAAGIHPRRAAGKVSRAQYQLLVQAIKDVLRAAIKAGGTTLRDFTRSDGKPGYFRLSLQIYDHAGEPCPKCGKPISLAVIAQRATYYCTHCQH
ncbi:MAG: bifunctional DNA-formamidopyrimidine glycosylase/DNA-(apurinic or apyrimidinic site) lyase [Gammaproteobacteria bacterium]|nr:bifunctional DNA-formamidopyrimidine glycosylase/DNA-(apurinic or apyrimidinic site) lyase [Gammaproteobacteria bacterium]